MRAADGENSAGKFHPIRNIPGKIVLLHLQIELQAALTPDAVALRQAGRSLSYAELDRQANRCARYLRELGVGPDVIVGVLMERSVELVVALLGILKAGGAYLPLDPAHPQARLDFVLDDAGVPAVLTQPALAAKLGGFGGTVLVLDPGEDALAGYEEGPLERVNGPDDLAYVIYTSGSTGQPKGCLLTHRAICNRLDWMQAAYRLDGGDRVLQKTPYTFDVSVWEFFWPLRAGATLVMARPQGHKDSHYLCSTIREEGITVCHFVPSMLRFFLDDAQAPQCTSLRDVFVSGEALPFELLRRFKALMPSRLHNLYGPTEAAVDVSSWECEVRADQVVPIGRAIANIELHVLDEALRPLPRGQEGELYIAGVGLARGYLNRPELTAERFVPNPFGEPGSRMYRTGDRVRELEDGNIEFLGRMDFQVKLRGLRIELGEIEATLRALPGVNEAAVLVRDEEAGDAKLVAYVEPLGAAPDFRAVRAFVRERLPEYMVPHIVAVMPRLPVTPHGKLDRKALPWPVASGLQPGAAAQAPAEATAVAPVPASAPAPAPVSTAALAAALRPRLAGFVAELLRSDGVAEGEDLFDLGATSLTLVRLAEWIRQAFGVEVPVDRFLDTPTVQGLADFVAQAGGPALQAVAAEPATQAPAAPAAEPAPPAAPVSPAVATGQPLAQRLCRFVAELLHCGELGEEADLFDLGATSLSLVRVAEWVRQQFGVDVPVDVFLDAPSVRGIAGYLRLKGVPDAAPAPEAGAAAPAAVQAAVPAEAAALAPAPAPTQPLTALPPLSLRASAYLPPSPQRFGAGPLAFEAFSAWLGLLGAEEQGGKPRYMHPCGGGLNAVRSYVAVKPGAVQGLDGGVYYFHPVARTLHRVGDAALLGREAFAEADRDAFDSAALAVFFVAALDAIVPIYQQVSAMLVAVDAGYMGQLLMGRQSAHGLQARPVARVDYARIEAAFDLGPGERFVHCLLAGAAAPGAPAGTPDALAALQRQAPFAPGASTLSHRALRDAPIPAPLSKEATAQLHHEQRHLRDVSALPAACRLDAAPFPRDAYRLRACQRVYETAVLPLRSLSGLLGLVRAGAEGARLHGTVTGRPRFEHYLYVRGGRIEGLAEGTYHYDPERHALRQCSGLPDAAMAQAYSPYNRQHYKSSAFCLFLVQGAGAYPGLDEEETIHLPLLEAGYLGQVLMEHQAEFGIGLCPIGGLRFDVLRPSLGVGEAAVLLHSFTGGGYRHEIPAGWPLLAQPAGADTAPPVAQPQALPAQALAIVGLAGRYPGAETPQAFWENLSAGVSSVAPMPAERLAQLAQDTVPAPRAGGYLAQIDGFDSLLFGISPAEARTLDPQERLLLECAFACLEDAGYTAEELASRCARTGVFIGTMYSDYQHHGVQVWERQGRVEEFSNPTSLANRLSYLFNFSGPSVAVNTSCSSGMTALHLACESIRRGECDAALVGGVSLVSHAYHAQQLETIDFLSKEDACRPFSAQANGWILGEGVGAVLIKRAEAALRDQDHVHALIRGSAIGHSGRTARFGTPSSQQQERLIRQALEHAGLAPRDIDYVEAAAPGAGMADAVEMSAIKAVFAGRDAPSPCRVGSVKANVGHLESASVFSQLTKVLLQLRHGQLAPSLHSRPRNPLIALEGSGLEIVEAPSPWTPAGPGRPRRALINAVGAAGSEGHLVLEELVCAGRAPAAAEPLPVLLSAATAAQLRQQAQRLLDFVEQAPATRLDDLSLTLRQGRVAMAERLAFVVPDLAALGEALRAWLLLDEPAQDTALPGNAWRGRAARGLGAAADGAELHALAQHWVRGGTVDWSGLPAAQARRIPLPTYPFERVRHWIGRAAGVEEAEAGTPAPAAPAAPVSAPTPDAAEVAVQDKALAHLLRLVAGVTEVPASRLDADAPLEGYGLNSLMIEALNRRLEEAYGALSKTLFFEVRTLRQLATGLVQQHREAALRLFGQAPAASAPRALPAPAAPAARDVAAPAVLQPGEPIAIVGLAGRYPKAATLRELWDKLAQGVDCISEIPAQRWDHARFLEEGRGKPGKTYSKWGGFIDGVDEFDPMFFGITPREAAAIDPQERLFLQTAWHAVEDAGYTRESLRAALGSRVGVFVGVMYGEYQLYPSLPGGLGTTSTYGTIANRVSYVLDLHGPSMAVDTLCSSSLTAIHLACESLRRGECAAALAGGVSLSLHPAKYLTHALFGMSASDGRCRSFGEGGDGFVPGEGVGAVLLKPLSRALADGDLVYGLIKGSALNHGGRTNGFTVPDPRAQAELVRSALAHAGVPAQAVSYIEAHGTGTALGDPVEISGLAQAFGERPASAPGCAIGSIKSNIGHCEAAAGIAGLTKVLLQMRHRTLARSLHAETLNPFIDFGRTPFVVQTETAPWPRPVLQLDDGPCELPRIAGLSSFGAGGANAHVVVQEYELPALPVLPVSPQRPAALVLSARTAEALREQARRLCEAIAAGEVTDDNLAHVAYTLQVGREAMECRLALLAGSAAALQARLEAWLGGAAEAEGLYLGEVKRGKDTLAAFAADEDMAGAIAAWIAKGKLDKLLELWVQGLSFDWHALHASDGVARPRRISLPGYPFARERCWVDMPADGGAEAAGTGAPALHPLLQRNTSDLQEQRFSTRLRGDEFFLADHVVQGRRVLPGVACLEMAREALARGAGVAPEAGVRLKDVAWMRPVVVGEAPVELHLGLYPAADADGTRAGVEFEVYGADELVHCQGRAEAFTPGAAQVLDLAALRAQCGQAELAAAQVYERFAALGLAYGPAHRAIGTIHVGAGQALARLVLPEGVAQTAGEYVLHPSLLDGALQAVIGLAFGDAPGPLALPFAVEEVEIMGRCSARMWALVQPAAGRSAQDAVRKADITLCDDAGVVVVRLKGYASRVVEGPLGGAGVLLLQPCWREQVAAGEAPPYLEHQVLLCGVGVAAQELCMQLGGTACEALPPGIDLAAEYGEAVQRLCARVQDILGRQPAAPVLLQVVVPAQGARQALAGLAGVLKTARQEQPQLLGQVVVVEAGEDAQSLAAKLAQDAARPQDVEVRHVGGRREVAGWQEIAAEPQALVPWRENGIYLITGGLGGLALLLAREIAQRARGATLVLTGRRALDEAGRERLHGLQALGARAEYHAVDVADGEAVRQLVQGLRERHTGLHGIVHAAGVLRDGLLLKKTPQDIAAVLAPKVAGLVNLDEASRDLALDWLLCFSSLNAARGNPGQADYAAANAFMDAYAAHRNALAAQGLRHGRALSLNWPLWQDGGMGLDTARVQAMEQLTGLKPLGTEAGLAALYRALGAAVRDGLDQAMVLEGVPGAVRRWLAGWAAPAAAQPQPAVAAVEPPPLAGPDEASLRERALPYFKRLLAKVFSLPADRIEADVALDNYGIDSILVMQLTAELEQSFGPLSKTLFYEYQTLDAVVGHFRPHHRERLAALVQQPARPAPGAAQVPSTAGAAAPAPALAAGRMARRRRGRFTPAAPDNGRAAAGRSGGGIAIIGVAGRYPQARDLKAFWRNLREGRDCVTEIPPERWDHSRYFDPDKNKLGTTYSKWGGFIDGVDEFDPQFFSILPRDAEFLDPQERLFLQCVHAALEDAGYTRETLGRCSPQRRVGVYAGVFLEEYQLFGAQEQARGNLLALSGSPASIANRVSYWFNLRGPSLSVDTMCSSSLSAIHLACESLRSGECELAIAGGVNLTLHPNKYLLLAQGKFASSKGRCESFGDGGDGYVPAEGVGALILKPLERAIADGDSIHGVIRATALNHGGKTNGYTVPNPVAQAELIGRALKDAGMDPRSISYVEAHGTGTSLGDPIEIAGLSQAFGEHTADRQFCAIGSVKSNIGHGEAVAGIAGVTKVLLQMRHGQLAPSLHSRTLNPNIDFATTPFVVQQQLAEWKRPVVQADGGPVELPRRAGVSSFGAGGTNVHVLIEEHRAVAPAGDDAAADGPVAVVLSARNVERLHEQARQLLDALADEDGAAARLADIAYTLQVGREVMEERLALLVDSPEALRGKLAAWLDGQDGIEGVYRGRSGQSQEALAVLGGDEDMAGTIGAWIAKGKLSRLLELWVKGLAFDWNRLYGERKPRRISLPTYPFARERYWVPAGAAPAAVPAGVAAAAALHPLLHRNTSDFSEQRFSTWLAGDEFFLADHRVQGRPVLPGVAQLEMVREALVRAAGAEAATGVRLLNVAWTRPVVVEEPMELHVGLEPQAQGSVAFEVYSGEDTVHCQGRAELFTPDGSERLDLAALQAQCGRAQLGAAACYEGFAALGLGYGPAQQAIETIHLGSGQALARLVLPSTVAGSAGDYVLHPSLVDGALQAVAGLGAEDPQTRLALPFGVEAVEIVGRCSPRMWVLVQPSAGSTAQDKVRKADVTLCGDDGVVAVRIKGYASRVVEGPLGGGGGATAGVLLLQPRWREQAAASAASQCLEHQVLLCGVGVEGAALQAQLAGAQCETLPEAADVAAGYAEAARRLCARVRDILLSKPAAPVLLQVVVPAQGERQLLSGLAGLLRTARLEQPRLVAQLIAVDEDGDAASLAAKLAEDATSPQDVAVRHVQGRREVAGWEEIAAEAEALVPWKAGGVYLLTGGLGGLGLIFAREIAQRARGATLVLAGRRALDEAGRGPLRELEALGATVEYRAVDVADRAAVRQLVLQVQEDHQALHGIVHAAGVLRDGLLLNKTAQDVDAVLAPKVAGLVNLDEASRDIELEWLICFSSVSAALGHVGQADYAAANGFMDAHAAQRNALAAQGLRHGRALSLNWPLWREGGMRVDAATEQRMAQLGGLQPLGTAAGIAALYRVLGTVARDGSSQAMVLEGTPAALRRALSGPTAEPVPAAEVPAAVPVAAAGPAPADAGQATPLKERAVQHLRRMLARVFKLPVEHIEAEVPLDQYGIDSIVAMQLTAELEQSLGALSKTLFFEYQTLDALVTHLLDSHREGLARLLQPAAQATAPVAAEAAGPTRAAVAELPAAPGPARRRRHRLAPVPQAGGRAGGGIAIIGVAGRYPQARDLVAFWRNLREGRDCVTEIPAERWDHARYFDPDKSKPGSTYSKWGGFIDGVDEFDPQFFNISPREAEFLDPQERMFLQCVHAALEDAGYTRETLGQCTQERNVGVYAGACFEEYPLFGAQEQARGHHVAVGSNPAALANRVSYWFNLHGPSVSVNTMCSSSLTAIHMACESLRSGECALAIAGGVNLSLHPNKYLALAQGKFASSQGRCVSFGEGGDGYVPAEGVGAVILKPLERAIADGDQVYGVIRASAINHGGKTNGYTVPNPLAQAGVIGRALQDSGFDARSIGYIEAHGTGTSLGDPIEITGLSKAFGEHTSDRQFCAIGSVKSNIGHGEAVAGVAGVTKVLLQMRHGQLAPSLHSRTLNPNIDFATTPFVVQQQLAEWVRPVLEIDGRRVELPRRAGVSSFGAGGSNAHVLIEEFMAPPRARPASAARPALVVLSARQPERLSERAADLLAALDRGELGEEDLGDVAYTLQVGREAMEERLALAVGSMAELKARLAAWLAGEDGIEALYRGQVKRNKEALAAFADDDLAGAIEAWIAKGKLHKLLDLWVKGLALDWNKLHGEPLPRRISLPTYPFARERYWVPQFKDPAPAQGAVAAGAVQPVLHPLVQRNTSRLTEQRFSTRLTGGEFFLAEHQVQGRRVLPGVAYLEMAREALVQAQAFDAGAAPGLRLGNVVWARPVVVGETPVELHIGLYVQADAQVAFEVFGGEGEVHGQGVATPLAEAPPPLDLAVLRARCGRGVLEGEACYAGFAALGFGYGPAFRGIERIYLGEGQALARLQLPAGVDVDGAGFVLHPGVLDAALQAAAALAEPGQASRLALPFAVEEVQILGRCRASMWALAQASAGSSAQDRVRKVDITLCDDDGAVAVRLKGFASRVVEDASGGERRVLLMQPRWREQAAAGAAAGYAQHHVLLCGVGEDAALQAQLAGAQCEALPEAADVAAGYAETARRLCARVRDILLSKPAAPVLLQVVVPAQGERQLLSGLAGLLRTARLEQPRLVAQLIAVDEDGDAASLAAKLAEDATSPQDVAVRHVQGRREVAGWEEIAAEAEALVPWKAGGVYLLTGGLGGLGLIFAREIAQRARGATLVLAGRRALDEAGRGPLRELEALGATVEYRAVDVADRAAVRQLVLQVQEDHQALHGIVHAAGVLRDGLLLNKTAQDVDAVLAPKVAGLVNLDEASRDIELEWLICFSSVSAALGHVGQADYAAANGFMDAHAAQRNALAAQGLRHGRALSLNWPLWREGGMRVDAATEQRMAQLGGLQPLDSEAGLAALYRLLGAAVRDDLAQAMALQGTPARLRQLLAGAAQPPAAPVEAAATPAPAQPEAGAAAGGDTGELPQRILRVLKQGVSALLKVRLEAIDGEAELSEFGFDSVTLTDFGNELNRDYGIALAPTIFFEHPTLNALAQHLAKEHGSAFAARLPASAGPRAALAQAPAQAVPGHEPPLPAATGAAPRRAGRSRPAPAALPAPAPVAAPAAAAHEPIAIIGMSGRFPMAADLQAFWDQLVGEQDCISEVPASRWDWRALHGDPAREPNKTNVKWGGFIDGVEEFDPLFFGISPKEAEAMDPQQRLLMLYVWKAIEDAGYAAGALAGSRTALYVGTGASGYAGLLMQAGQAIEGYTATGMVASVGPNRMSYLLDLHGPSEPVETACSSSLVALRKGVVAIESGGCEMAIVGGINTILTPEAHISFSKAGMLSEDGRCKTFSAQANGYVRGEGVGMLVLKRLSATERDGDHIHGLIRGTAENHGGRAASLTAPNPKAQARLLQEAYTAAGVDPRSIGYIEAHGTGTPLGDPVEVNGLKMAFKALYQAVGAQPPAQPHCGLGSVKTNIGHLELAAGVAGVIKVLLQLRHKTLVRSLHCEEINPYIDLQGSPFYLLRETGPWPALRDEGGRELPRRAGVSSFGFGGVNAHVVIEEYVPAAPRPAAPLAGPALVVLSAKNAERLREQAQQLHDAIAQQGWGDAVLADLAYTLQVGREAMDERLGVVAQTMAQLQQTLAAFLAGREDVDDLFRGQVRRNREALSVFAADEELQEAVAKWVQRGKLAKVLELWSKGLPFDWNTLYGESRPRRMSLPTYPFARERYWIPEPPAAAGGQAPGRRAAPTPGPAAGQAGTGFDEAFHLALLDRVMDGSLSVDAAAQEMDA
jgi:polyketide synthase PksN